MTRFGSALLTLVVTCAAASAGEETTVTVAVIRDVKHPTDGLWVATAEGHRRILRGAVALAVAEDAEVFTVGGTLERRVIQASWVEATSLEQIPMGGLARLRAGAKLRIVRTQRIGERRRYGGIYSGRRVWLEDHQVLLTPRPSPLSYGTILGEALHGGAIQTALGRVQVVGPNTTFIKSGLAVSGYGLHFVQAKKVLLTELHGTTTEGTKVHRDLSPTSERMPIAPRTPVLITGQSPGGRFLRIKFTWPGTDAIQAYIPREHVAIGQRSVEVTGTLSTRTQPFSIQRPDGGVQQLRLGGLGALPVKVLQPHGGKRVTVTGVLESDGRVRVRTVRAVIPFGLPETAHRPAIPKGTVVDVRADLLLGKQMLVTLPSGRAVLVPSAALTLEAKTGAAAKLGALAR